MHIRHYGLHQSSARKEKLPQARALLGLERAVPAVKELDLKEWLKEILGEEAVDRCPHCGAAWGDNGLKRVKIGPVETVFYRLLGPPVSSKVGR